MVAAAASMALPNWAALAEVLDDEEPFEKKKTKKMIVSSRDSSKVASRDSSKATSAATTTTSQSGSKAAQPLPSPRRASEVVAAAEETEHQDLEVIPASALSIAKLIGKGRFKQVHAGAFRRREVVVLCYSAATDKENTAETELRILRHMPRDESRSFVPEVFGISREVGARGKTLLVQERAAFGSLKAALLNAEAGALITPAVLLRIAAQLSRAMDFLGLQRIVHADLACRNVLLFKLTEDPDNTLVKVTDFGLAKILPEESDSIVSKQPQATRWCAPEGVAASVLSLPADAWSLGATLWELFSRGKSPWFRLEKRVDVAVRLKRLADVAPASCAATPGTMSPRRQKEEKDISNEFPKPADCPSEFYSSILSCLQAEPQLRPQASAVASSARALYEDDREASERRTSSTSAGDSSPSSPATVTPRLTFEGAPDAVEALCLDEDVLETDEATEANGADASALLQLKLGAQRSQELFVADFVQRRADATRPGFSQREEVQTPMASPRWPRPVSSASDYFGFTPRDRNPDYFGFTPRDRSPQPTGDGWVLSSCVSSVVRRRLFSSEDAAWAHFQEHVAQAIPCSLCDPCGVQRGSHAWVELPASFKHTIICSTSAAADVAVYASPVATPRFASPVATPRFASPVATPRYA